MKSCHSPVRLGETSHDMLYGGPSKRMPNDGDPSPALRAVRVSRRYVGSSMAGRPWASCKFPPRAFSMRRNLRPFSSMGWYLMAMSGCHDPVELSPQPVGSIPVTSVIPSGEVNFTG